MGERRQVLVVADDKDQLETLCRGLRLAGLACAPARTAAEVQSCLEGPRGDEVDTLIADLTFPGGPTTAAVERALALRPGLRGLMVVGLVLTEAARRLRGFGLTVLRKPFGPDELKRAVDRLER